MIECKKYTNPVPVDDVEEFWAKIEQVAGVNVKGIFVSTHSFQASTIKYAKAKGLGLLRYFDDANVKWDLYRQPISHIKSYGANNDSVVLRYGLTNELFCSVTHACYCYINNIHTDSATTLFQEVISSSGLEDTVLRSVKNRRLQKRVAVERLTQIEIEQVCAGILRESGYVDGAVPLDTICQREQDKNHLIVRDGVPPSDEYLLRGILGTIRFFPSVITLFSLPNHNEFRQRFTLAHELGHYFLNHSRYMIGEYCQEKDFRLNVAAVGVTSIQNMEWQANKFASYLLLPVHPFVRDFLSLSTMLQLRDKGFGTLYLDHQWSNRMRYHALSNFLEAKYKVSRTVVRIRLQQLNLLVDGRKKAWQSTSPVRYSELAKSDMSHMAMANQGDGPEDYEPQKSGR